MLLKSAASVAHWMSTELSGSSVCYAEQFVNLQSEGTLKAVSVNSRTLNSQSYFECPQVGSTRHS